VACAQMSCTTGSVMGAANARAAADPTSRPGCSPAPDPDWSRRRRAGGPLSPRAKGCSATAVRRRPAPRRRAAFASRVPEVLQVAAEPGGDLLDGDAQRHRIDHREMRDARRPGRGVDQRRSRAHRMPDDADRLLRREQLQHAVQVGDVLDEVVEAARPDPTANRRGRGNRARRCGRAGEARAGRRSRSGRATRAGARRSSPSPRSAQWSLRPRTSSRRWFTDAIVSA